MSLSLENIRREYDRVVSWVLHLRVLGFSDLRFLNTHLVLSNFSSCHSIFSFLCSAL